MKPLFDDTTRVTILVSLALHESEYLDLERTAPNDTCRAQWAKRVQDVRAAREAFSAVTYGFSYNIGDAS